MSRKKAYHKPWNHPTREIDEKVMLLKENEPSVTVRKAKEVFEKEGIKIALKGIWSIWKRYGLTSIPRNKPTLSFCIKEFPETSEIKAGLIKVQELLDKNNIKKATGELNNLPYCPSIEILNKISNRFLSLRRQIEKFPSLFGKIPFPEYRRKMKILRKKLEKNGLYYSALRAGIEEALALQWMGKPKEIISLINHLQQRLNKKGEPSLRISLLLLKGIAYNMLFKIKEAKECVSKCNRKLLASFPFLNMDLAGFYSSICDIKRAIYFAERGLRNAPVESKKIFYEMLSYLYSLAGNYRASDENLKKVEGKTGIIGLTGCLIRAQHLGKQGRLSEASNLIQKILLESKKEVILSHLHATSLLQAGIYAGLGDAKNAKSYIKRYISILVKSKMRRDVAVRYALLGQDIPQKALLFSPIYLISLIKKASESLRKKDYRKAYYYAFNNALLGIFHRFILFFPEAIISLLEKGQQTGLPRTILRLPVFNQEIPVYHIKFLGSMIVNRNQKYLRVKLKPKDSAFLMFLCSKTAESGKFINLKDVYDNFWAKSENPVRNLSHLLIRMKKALKIPSHLLTVSTKKGIPSLINEGIYFTTDYQKSEQTFIQANALFRAGEWSYAKKEYLRAFALFRGEPFKKMYDNWSENMRRVILNKLETEAVHFAKSCLEHKNKKDAKRLLEKVLKIIPNSEEMKDMVKSIV